MLVCALGALAAIATHSGNDATTARPAAPTERTAQGQRQPSLPYMGAVAHIDFPDQPLPSTTIEASQPRRAIGPTGACA